MNGGTRLLLILASVAMIGAVLCGLHVLGSPAHQRDLRLDARRTENLHLMTMSIHDYWMKNHVMPVDLSTMDIQASLKSDPVTGKPYGYKRLSDESYSLCADFSAASEDSPETHYMLGSYAPVEPQWKHPAGLYCFSFQAKTAGTPME